MSESLGVKMRAAVVSTITCTAGLLVVVWFYASIRHPFWAVWTAALMAVATGRCWYFIGKIRGLTSSDGHVRRW